MVVNVVAVVAVVVVVVVIVVAVIGVVVFVAAVIVAYDCMVMTFSCYNPVTHYPRNRHSNTSLSSPCDQIVDEVSLNFMLQVATLNDTE